MPPGVCKIRENKYLFYYIYHCIPLPIIHWVLLKDLLNELIIPKYNSSLQIYIMAHWNSIAKSKYFTNS
jgi:membrane-anchored glycerophosphoryl diester phosphodiesterase (GDPDase)